MFTPKEVAAQLHSPLVETCGCLNYCTICSALKQCSCPEKNIAISGKNTMFL